ncbi:tetratricopeptide repeat protein [Geitlerinema calcuttense]|nr:tetratricopeptide repeat protein [Geitlerinema calcuttense]
MGKRPPAAFCLWVLLMAFMLDCPAQESAPAPDPVTALWQEAHGQFASGSFKDAAKGFEQFVSRIPQDDPRLPEALYLQGSALTRDKGMAFASALRVWETLPRRFPSSEWSARALGDIITHYDANNDPQSERFRRQLLEQFPSSPVTVSIITAQAEKLFTAKKYPAAAYLSVESSLDESGRRNLLLARTLAEAGSNPRKLLEAGDMLFLSGGDEQKDILQAARDIYLEALKGQNQLSKDELARLKTRLGWAYYQGTPEWKDIDKAETLWREVITQNPKDNEWAIESRWYLVQLHAGPKQMKDDASWKKAVQYADDIIKNAPAGTIKHEQSMFAKAWLCWAHSSWADALSAFNEFIRLYPEKRENPFVKSYIAECKEKISSPTQ